jgi:hypothetical protein
MKILGTITKFLLTLALVVALPWKIVYELQFYIPEAIHNFIVGFLVILWISLLWSAGERYYDKISNEPDPIKKYEAKKRDTFLTNLFIIGSIIIGALIVLGGALFAIVEIPVMIYSVVKGFIFLLSKPWFLIFLGVVSTVILIDSLIMKKFRETKNSASSDKVRS